MLMLYARLSVQATGMIGNSFCVSEGRLFLMDIGRGTCGQAESMAKFIESIIEKCTTGALASKGLVNNEDR